MGGSGGGVGVTLFPSLSDPVVSVSSALFYELPQVLVFLPLQALVFRDQKCGELTFPVRVVVVFVLGVVVGDVGREGEVLTVAVAPVPPALRDSVGVVDVVPVFVELSVAVEVFAPLCTLPVLGGGCGRG